MQTALADVREQTKMSVSYNSSQLPNTRISLDINNQPLEQALNTILAGTGFTYTVKDTYIMIIPEQAAKKSKSRNVAGNVVDGKGDPLIGVTVLEKGTANGTVTNIDGNYHITTQGATPILVFSYIGYQPKEVAVKENVINVVLEDGSQALDEVVVTALGIKRAEKALSYNVQTVSNSELTAAKDANFMNSLNGKVAGVNIQKSSSGVGGATRVIMRGSKS
ncbi:SusC/RagA family TonB-linked outer membrane protein, partial [Bacteroides acidifaciens]|uniref:STN domain-containing protein n=1 Tax=Bacteroides acidifaciens TaxID=85831 RepID=UPI002431A4CF